jgi:hypothetical protein
MSQQWYYQVKGEVLGPLPLEELKQKADDNTISGDSLVREGTDGPWLSAKEVSHLSNLLLEAHDVAQSGEEVMRLAEGGPEPEGKKLSIDRSPLALHPCVDCGKMVSRQARACPNCGRLFHESSMMIRYRGEQPVPILVLFTVLAIGFVLLSPLAVYFVTINIMTKFMDAGEASGVALVVTIVFACSTIASAVLGGAVGKPRMAYLTGIFLGVFFGPLGVFAAFAIDKRPQCVHCSSRLNGLSRECPSCHARLTWKVEPSWF